MQYTVLIIVSVATSPDDSGNWGYTHKASYHLKVNGAALRDLPSDLYRAFHMRRVGLGHIAHVFITDNTVSIYFDPSWQWR